MNLIFLRFSSEISSPAKLFVNLRLPLSWLYVFVILIVRISFFTTFPSAAVDVLPFTSYVLVRLYPVTPAFSSVTVYLPGVRSSSCFSYTWPDFVILLRSKLVPVVSPSFFTVNLIFWRFSSEISSPAKLFVNLRLPVFGTGVLGFLLLTAKVCAPETTSTLMPVLFASISFCTSSAFAFASAFTFPLSSVEQKMK